MQVQPGEWAAPRTAGRVGAAANLAVFKHNQEERNHKREVHEQQAEHALRVGDPEGCLSLS